MVNNYKIERLVKDRLAAQDPIMLTVFACWLRSGACQVSDAMTQAAPRGGSRGIRHGFRLSGLLENIQRGTGTRLHERMKTAKEPTRGSNLVDLASE